MGELSPSPKVSLPPFRSRSPSSASFLRDSVARKAADTLREYFEEVGRFTRLDPREEWLPITESRKGNAYYAAFHTLCSGIGFQALVLPLAFTALGWGWGIVCLSTAFVWQLYTLWLLIQLHESVPGTRHSRYLWLSMHAFGEKLGKAMALFPTLYLSSGTCITLIIIGGGAMRLFFQTVFRNDWSESTPLTNTEWHLVFMCSAIVLSQLPNLNSIAGVSLVGAVTAVTYCTVIWTASLIKGRPENVTYGLEEKSEIATVCGVLNAVGIIVFAFRGHNLVLEIQGTMPSSVSNPSHVPMWRGVKFSYLVIALCLFPLAIGGYWAYGNLIPKNGGMLSALYEYHKHEISRPILGATSALVVINALTSFQIYAMPVFDNLELRYVTKMNGPCPWWVRALTRCFFGGLTFFVSVALPFLPSLAGLIGGIALPVTFVYPSLMWIVIKKPEKLGPAWWLNWALGCAGIALSILLVFGAIWTIVARGIEVNFFKP